MVLIFSNQSCHAKNLSEIDYKAVVPEYINYVIARQPCEKAVNEAILARHFLALQVPELSARAHEANAYIALYESVSWQEEILIPPLSPTTRSVLKVALEQTHDNCAIEFDKSCYASLLDQAYYEFPPVSQEALDGIQNRVTLFGQSLSLLACL